MVKKRSIRPPSNDNLGPTSEFVHEMVGLSPNFGPLSTWTNGRVDGPQTAVFVLGGLSDSLIFWLPPSLFCCERRYWQLEISVNFRC